MNDETVTISPLIWEVSRNNLIYPECMKPDGAEPCLAYQELNKQIKIMREALNKIRKKGNQLSSAVALTALIRTGFKEDIE